MFLLLLSERNLHEVVERRVDFRILEAITGFLRSFRLYILSLQQYRSAFGSYDSLNQP